MAKLHPTLSALLIIFGIGLPVLIGALTPGYDPLSDYLSELGAAGAPNSVLMSYGVFLTAGLIWTASTFAFWRAQPGIITSVAAILLLGTAVSYIGAAFYPCDAGCPMEGSAAQDMHNTFGIVGYLATPPALALAAAAFFARGRKALGILSLAVCAAFISGFVLMIGDHGGSLMGLWQRLADFSLFLWMAVTLPLLSRRAQAAPP
ncbi:MAG: DUF998 domain-containing protein [Hyphomonas sp.]